MYRLKAFGTFPAFYNNDAGVVNPIGELSSHAETFASDVPLYKRTSAPNSILRTFLSVNEVSPTEKVGVKPNELVVAQVLSVMEYLYTHSISGEITNDKGTLIGALMNVFAGQIQTIELGDMVKDAQFWLPSWISWEGTATNAPYATKIWFADGHFRGQFDEYEIRPYAGIDNIDGFFNTATAVKAIVKSITIRDMMARGDGVANGQPPTLIDVEEFEWVDPLDKTNKILVPWGFVTYSEAGLNIDAKKQELIKWIMAHTTHTLDEWTELFPDIFGATEYIFTPSWWHIAIPGDQINGGVFSPVNHPATVIAAVKALTKGVDYTPAYIDANVNIAACVYKQVQLGVVGGPRNRDDIHQFGNRWDDYLALSTSHIDFGRMSEPTQKMVVILINLLKIAETMTVSSDMPHGYLRTIRDGVMYVSASTDRTQLLVASRQSVEAVYPPTLGV